MQPALLQLACGITRDEDAAFDVVQCAFLQVVLHAGEFEGRSALRTWVWRITANEALQWHRKRARADRKLAEVWNHRTLLGPPAAATPFEALDRRRALERVDAALAKLSVSDREILGASLGATRPRSSSPGAPTRALQRPLRARLYRARQRLRRALQDDG